MEKLPPNAGNANAINERREKGVRLGWVKGGLNLYWIFRLIEAYNLKRYELIAGENNKIWGFVINF